MQRCLPLKSAIINNNNMYLRRTRNFSRARMRSSNSARMNKSNNNNNKNNNKLFIRTYQYGLIEHNLHIINFIRLRKSCSVHMAVFKIVAHRNVNNWIQLLT